MPINTEQLNRKLYDVLDSRGYQPKPLDTTGKVTPVPEDAAVIKFDFIKDGTNYGKVWVSIDGTKNLQVYYGDDVSDSPEENTSGTEYSDNWSSFLQYLKSWAQRRQLGFELKNENHLVSDMSRRHHIEKKEKIGESTIMKNLTKKKDMAEGIESIEQVNEGYYPMGKQGSYSDAIPTTKIILQHTRKIEEGEQRYRNVAKIFVENSNGERFLLPTTKPGIARVYARHIAEGGTPYDERGKHITSLVEEYQKMAGFVRATKNKQFNESAQQLVNEGLNHYQSLRETLSKMTGRRGYNAYFESYTPTLIENDVEENLNELFVQETLDPRIESVMPILSRLHKKVGEMTEVNELAEWADSLLETEKDDEEESEHDEWYDSDGKVNPKGAYDAGGHFHLERTVDESAPPGMEKWIKDRKADFKKRYGDRWKEVLYATAWKQHNKNESVEEAEGAETLKHNQDTEEHNLKAFGLAEDGNIELRDVEDYKARLKALQDIITDPDTAKDPLLKRETMRRLASLKKEAKAKGFVEGTYGVQEDLDADQKRAGQLGPTEKVGPEGAVGKLVGGESAEPKDEMLEGSILKSIKRGIQGWDKNAIGPSGEKLGDPREIVKRAKAMDTDTAKTFRAGLDNAPEHTPAGLQKRVLDRKLKGMMEGLTKQARAKKEAESVKAAIARLEQELKDPNPHINKDDIRRRLETEKRRLELYRDVLDEQGAAEGSKVKTAKGYGDVVQGTDVKTIAKADLGKNKLNLPQGYGDVVQPQKLKTIAKAKGVAEGQEDLDAILRIIKK